MSIENVLLGVLGFDELETPTLQAIVKTCSRKSLAKGEFLMRQGDDSQELYIVTQGRFSVLTDNRPIAEIYTGEPIGELAFFTSGKRTADVQATRNSEVLCITKNNYKKLSNEFPELSESILKTLSTRLANTTKSSQVLRPKAGQITSILPMTGQSVPEKFKTDLKKTLSDANNYNILDEYDIPEEVTWNVDSLSDWIKKQEQKKQKLILICTNKALNEAWYSAILEFSDVTFLTGKMLSEQMNAPQMDASEKHVFYSSRKKNIHLIIYREHQSETVINSTAWLRDRDVGMHHHLALDNIDDIERISRFIQGEALGLVMCGGGAFGAAHLGAIKAMQERGIVFDMVGGTSIGAANSTVLAMGIDPFVALENCENMFIKNKAMGRLTIPLYGMVDHHKLDQQLDHHLGSYNVEDLPINYFAVTTSLTNNDIKVIRKGYLPHAVRASTSLPGIFPAFVSDDGEVLVDGGLLDNVPISIMRDLKAGPNIIFNFKFNDKWRSKGKYNDLPNRKSALAIFLRLKKRLKPSYPSTFSVLTRSMVVSARRLMDNTDIGDDILIELTPMDKMGFLEWKKARKQYEIAYQDMNRTLDNIGLEKAAKTSAQRKTYIEKLQTHFKQTKS